MTVFHRTSQIFLAAFAPAHKLLPANPTRNLDDLSSVLNSASIGRVAFLRHGETAPSTGGDFERILTEEGRSQARQAGRGFGKELNPYFSVCLVSPAPRTMETAKIFLLNADANSVLAPIDVLYDGTTQPKGAELFQKIGYASLDSYLRNHDDVIRTTSQEVLGSYANS
ncbi:histidine phosphatase superfamily branch 1 protein [Nitzschia inconspicua]|uniref:Histidine phosphatase superfamily branch 1 protein n=1 Tax=Nitzschia inconspicua TaxID=303405 RepID=A0A9K3Q0N6_9STRA|nr:histidine phosphatase superfamily branch 1 protein [Nitzschia inconspicua]KAG7367107.1 histidine phosphatase superfamily branch 1 protein [Nitzschia inconspicua]